MKKCFQFALIALFTLGLIMGCKQDLQVTGPYKEVPVVYGLLNPTDSVHYIRIQKGYLVQGSAYLAAGIADSIYYPDVLKVTVKTLPNGATYTLKRVDGNLINLPKDSGVFNNSANILYAFSGPLDQTKTYSLQVVDTTSGKVISAQTNITGAFAIGSPTYGTKLTLSNVNPRKIVWTPGTNASIFDLNVRFYYLEYDQASHNVVKDSFVDIRFLKSYVYDPAQGPTVTVDLSSDFLFKNLANSLAARNDRYRTFNINKGMQFKFAVGGTDFSNFLVSQAAQNGGLTANESLPPFTNISGGTGIFSTRYFQEVDSVLLSNDGLDSLACSTYSTPLRFLNHSGQLCQ